jgi:hypothetical protein
LTAEGTSKGTGSISCEVEFCIFYRLILRTLRTKDAYVWKKERERDCLCCVVLHIRPMCRSKRTHSSPEYLLKWINFLFLATHTYQTIT